MRGILLFLAAVIGGPALIVTGIGDYKDSKKLIAEGKPTTALVTQNEQTRSRKGRRNYYLTVLFKPEQGEAITKRVSVSRELYTRAIEDKFVKATYLPSDPKIFQLGDKVVTKTSSIIIGSLLLCAALVVSAYKWITRSSNQDSTTDSGSSTSAPIDLKKAA